MLAHIRNHAQHITTRVLQPLRNRIARWTKPIPHSLVLGTLVALGRSKRELVAENLLLRQQLIVLNRSLKRPHLTRTDRVLFVLLARTLETWRDALLIIKPDTVLRWHRTRLHLFWKHRSKRTSSQPKVPAETVALIKDMAANNRLWGAERIRGELLKVGIRVGKRTIQKYMRHAPRSRPSGQPWATFLRNHAQEIWACDFLQVTDLLFRSLFAFFIVEHGSRRVVHVGVTRHPTDAWVTSSCGRRRRTGSGPASCFATTMPGMARASRS